MMRVLPPVAPFGGVSSTMAKPNHMVVDALHS